MIEHFDALAVRQMRSRRLRSAMTGFGVMLGVGMVFAVLLLVTTIHETFDQLMDSAYGSSDLVVTPAGGGRMPNRTLTTIERTPGVARSGAMIGSGFIRMGEDGKPIHGAKGVMMVAGYDADRSPYELRVVSGREALSGPEIVVEDQWSRTHHIGVGDVVTVNTPVGVVRLNVVGVFALSGGADFGGRGFAAVPLTFARRIMNAPVGWEQISLRTEDRSSEGVAAVQRQLRKSLGSGVRVQSPNTLGDQAASQLDALNVVLYFFSGIALFVGGFLILNSFNMTVLQRMREFGMLRTLGATPGMLIRNVMVEALIVGGIGTLLGLAAGLGLAYGLVAMMKGLGVPVGSVTTSTSALITAIAIGLIVTAAGAFLPARRAGRIAPIRAVLGGDHVNRKPGLQRLFIGLALFLPGCILGGRFWMGSGNDGSALSALLGISMTMGMFAGIAVAAPFLIMPVLRVLAKPLNRLSPTGGRLAVDSASGNPVRTAATAAALTIGLSVFVVNSAFTSSFLGSVRDQVDHAFAHDFTVQSIGGGIETGESFQISPRVGAEIARLPGAQTVSPLRSRFVELPRTNVTAANGLAIGIDPKTFATVDKTTYRDGVTARQAMAGVARGGVIIAPGYADLAKLHVGSLITITGPAGKVRAPVVAELDNMTQLGGMIIEMSIAQQTAVYGPMGDSQLLVKAAPGMTAALERSTRAVLERGYPNLEMQSSADEKKHISDQINQQFGLFNAILLVAVIVSIFGVINTLAMSVVERTREIGVLRALGSSRMLVRASLLDESLLVTIAGAVVGVAAGLIIAIAWIAGLGDVMPGMTFHYPAGATLTVALIAIVLGTLAAVLPARRAARLNVIDALSYE